MSNTSSVSDYFVNLSLVSWSVCNYLNTSMVLSFLLNWYFMLFMLWEMYVCAIEAKSSNSLLLFSAFWIHLFLTWIWIRIQILESTFGKSGSRSSDPPFHKSGSGSSAPDLEKVDPDLGPKVDLDPRTYYSILHIFYKEIHVGQITILILATAKNKKRHFSDNITFRFTLYST